MMQRLRVRQTRQRILGLEQKQEVFDAKLADLGMQIAAWGLHDLRRTLSTRLHDAGVEPLVIEALLAHKQQGVAAVYNRASFREAKRAALVALARNSTLRRCNEKRRSTFNARRNGIVHSHVLTDNSEKMERFEASYPNAVLRSMTAASEGLSTFGTLFVMR